MVTSICKSINEIMNISFLTIKKSYFQVFFEENESFFIISSLYERHQRRFVKKM